MKNFKPSFFFILKARLRKKSFLFEYYFKGKKALDIGCGEGEFMRNDPVNICGIDSNAGAVNKLRTHGFNAQVGDAVNLNFNNEEFDIINCNNVIEHLKIEEAYRMIKEAARVLKKNGLLVMGTGLPSKEFWNTFGHVKPYPPGAILKLFRNEVRESFNRIDDLEYAGLFYIGKYFNNTFLYFLSMFTAYNFPLLRRAYFIILKKKDIDERGYNE